MGEASTLAQESPKLLTLDKADVKAIRSFLPGKVLGRTAALLALVVLVLGFATSVDVGLERFLGFPLEPRWLKQILLFGIPILIVGAQIFAEWPGGLLPHRTLPGRAEPPTGPSPGRADRSRAEQLAAFKAEKGVVPHDTVVAVTFTFH
jgi:hypothetical protein